jgi:toxin ParE1/3/4
MRIRWTPAAIADLCSINDYLAEHQPHYRQPTMKKLHEAIYSLRRFPNRGRVGTDEGTREVFFAPLPYVAVYRVSEQRVEILRIYHAAQDR